MRIRPRSLVDVLPVEKAATVQRQLPAVGKDLTAPDLRYLLQTLYNAGASRVPASRLPWTADNAGAINRAINMQYVIRRERAGEISFSLSEAGYRAIDRDAPQYLSMARMIRFLFRGLGSGGDI